jgi:phosphoglucosamine mutase
LQPRRRIFSTTEVGLQKGPTRRAGPSELGRAKRLDDAGGRYIEFVKQSFPKGLRLDGLRVVVDCAHGAAYKVAPTVFWELGAEVFSVGISPDGFNINRECGALAPEHIRQEGAGTARRYRHCSRRRCRPADHRR